MTTYLLHIIWTPAVVASLVLTILALFHLYDRFRKHEVFIIKGDLESHKIDYSEYNTFLDDPEWKRVGGNVFVREEDDTK